VKLCYQNNINSGQRMVWDCEEPLRDWHG